MDSTSGSVRHCRNRILNSSYIVVAEFTTQDPIVQIDQHEFDIQDGGMGVIQAARIYHRNATGQRRFIEEAAFQEIDPLNGKVLFDWRSLEDVPRNETCISRDEPDYLCVSTSL